MKLNELLTESYPNLSLMGHHIDNGQLISDRSQSTVKDVLLTGTARVRLENLKNFPYKVTNRTDISKCPHLTTLEGSLMDSYVLNCIECPQLKSLEGIGRKYLKRMVKFFPTVAIERNVLGICLVKDLQRIDTLGYLNDPLENALGFALYQAMSDSPDVLECKEEMIAHNLKDFAKL